MAIDIKSVLVTGGAGFIGSHICERLVSMGIKVISLDNLSTGRRENIQGMDLKEVNGDILDEPLVTSLMKGIDIVFHNAASKKNICLDDPKRDLDINAKGTLTLLIAASRMGVKKFIHASTGSVYGEACYFPLDESHPVNPISYYGVSKLAGERYVQMFGAQFGLDTTILRYCHVYGPRQDGGDLGGVVAIFMEKLLSGNTATIFGDGTQQRSFTFVGDVVDANVFAAYSPLSRGKIYNCASGLKVTVNELYQRIANMIGCDSARPLYSDWVPGDIRLFEVSNEKIIGDLGIKFTSLDEGLGETLRWFEKQRENERK